MLHQYRRNILSVLVQLLLLSQFILIPLGCSKKGNDPEIGQESTNSTLSQDIVIFSTDSTEWHIKVIAEHKLYSEAIQVQVPSPWIIPTREHAQILHTLVYDHSERFITSDGYTFGMPSASVTKAGSKTKYSVLGLYIRQTIIDIHF